MRTETLDERVEPTDLGFTGGESCGEEYHLLGCIVHRGSSESSFEIP